MIERENPTSTKETSKVELSEEMSDIFAQLDAGHVEQFYKHYQIWLKQRRLALIQLQVSALQEAIEDNAALMLQSRPSAIALAALSQLQACGVDDIDLLDRMLARGDSWLDQTMELLIQCERMGFINDGYTLWCENALDGAFDWLVSMNEAASVDNTAAASSPAALATSSVPLKEVTEDLLLKKLMSEDGEETKKRTTITRPLAPIEEDFFSSLPVVPPASSPSRELFVIAALHATPLPAPEQAPESVEMPTSSEESPDAYAVLSTPEEVLDPISSDSEAATTTTTSTYEDSGITESIPRISIGARVRPENAEDYQITEAIEKVPALELATTASAVSSDNPSWKWKELAQYEMSVAPTDIPAPAQTGKEKVVVKSKRKIGFFRRLLNWLLGRTPDY